MLKKIILLSLLLGCIQTNLWAQKDPDAKALLDQMSARYQSLDGLKATFEYYYYNDLDGASQRSSGEVAVNGNRYKLVLPDQEVYNDGETVWTFIKSNNYQEVTVNTVSDNTDELTPSSIYNLYKKGYNYVLKGEKSQDGKKIIEILLTAESAKAQFQKIILFVDKSNKDLLAWEVSDSDGGTFKYEFNEVDTNVSLGKSFFTFDPQKYPGVEIIDLR
ncbi:LolA family protein [Echinicola vietnamensis]|uniref:Outer membrane lipoprotein-sorting protein n=1 Tax=Echinicola vietnamensis (strain DSM 17526 / LMG 23754 / KMM 6221) TaxID=926556 RepID=L0FYG1_ECHVK|nr:outer membrane lipoprotein carrier protein LolA [Echinicola vietnamensis]AGA78063.1 outer membrane lipoprotein-sorting protein [Echinicola vietnamensis DSM 17526]